MLLYCEYVLLYCYPYSVASQIRNLYIYDSVQSVIILIRPNCDAIWIYVLSVNTLICWSCYSKSVHWFSITYVYMCYTLFLLFFFFFSLCNPCYCQATDPFLSCKYNFYYFWATACLGIQTCFRTKYNSILWLKFIRPGTGNQVQQGGIYPDTRR